MYFVLLYYSVLAIYIYSNIVYLGYGHGLWKSTAYKYKGGSAKVKASWIYRGKLQTPIFGLLINTFSQCFKGTYAGGVLVVANAVGFMGAFLAKWGCKLNSHEWGLLWIGRGYRVEILQNERESLGLSMYKDMCVHLSECLYTSNEWVQVAGHCFIGNAIVLLILGCYFSKGVHRDNK